MARRGGPWESMVARRSGLELSLLEPYLCVDFEAQHRRLEFDQQNVPLTDLPAAPENHHAERGYKGDRPDRVAVRPPGHAAVPIEVQ